MIGVGDGIRDVMGWAKKNHRTTPYEKTSTFGVRRRSSVALKSSGAHLRTSSKHHIFAIVSLLTAKSVSEIILFGDDVINIVGDVINIGGEQSQ